MTDCEIRKDKTWLTYILYCTVEFIVSVPDLFLDIMSGNGYFFITSMIFPDDRRSRPRSVVACSLARCGMF